MMTVYEDTIPADVLRKILALARRCDIGEEFDTKCDLIYIWSEFDYIVACIAFRKYKFEEGRIVPRVEHIIYDSNHSSHKAARTSFRFLLKAFGDIKEKGYSQVWAYIGASKEYMKKMALKFGFNKYSEDSDGEYFALQLITK